jgi:hypothetical protein
MVPKSFLSKEFAAELPALLASDHSQNQTNVFAVQTLVHPRLGDDRWFFKNFISNGGVRQKWRAFHASPLLLTSWL